MPAKPPPKRKPGRPRLDQSGKQEVIRVRVAPGDTAAILKRYPNVNAGVRDLIRQYREASKPPMSL